jgi:hypothetical protein
VLRSQKDRKLWGASDVTRGGSGSKRGIQPRYTVPQAVLRSRWSSNFLLEPEPEPKLFLTGSGSGAGYVKYYKNPKFFILKYEVGLKNHIFVAIYFKQPFDDHFKSLKNMKIVWNHENCWVFLNYTGKMVRAGTGIFDKLEPEPHKNGPAPQHCPQVNINFMVLWEMQKGVPQMGGVFKLLIYLDTLKICKKSEMFLVWTENCWWVLVGAYTVVSSWKIHVWFKDLRAKLNFEQLPHPNTTYSGTGKFNKTQNFRIHT